MQSTFWTWNQSPGDGSRYLQCHNPCMAKFIALHAAIVSQMETAFASQMWFFGKLWYMMWMMTHGRAYHNILSIMMPLAHSHFHLNLDWVPQCSLILQPKANMLNMLKFHWSNSINFLFLVHKNFDSSGFKCVWGKQAVVFVLLARLRSQLPRFDFAAL
jgi:hypothetical protein